MDINLIFIYLHFILLIQQLLAIMTCLLFLLSVSDFFANIMSGINHLNVLNQMHFLYSSLFI